MTGRETFEQHGAGDYNRHGYDKRVPAAYLIRGDPAQHRSEHRPKNQRRTNEADEDRSDLLLEQRNGNSKRNN